jgi:hypothetical protein
VRHVGFSACVEGEQGGRMRYRMRGCSAGWQGGRLWCRVRGGRREEGVLDGRVGVRMGWWVYDGRMLYRIGGTRMGFGMAGCGVGGQIVVQEGRSWCDLANHLF